MKLVNGLAACGFCLRFFIEIFRWGPVQLKFQPKIFLLIIDLL